MACKAMHRLSGYSFHVIDRGKQGATIFHDAADYTTWPDLLERCRWPMTQ